MAVVSHWKGKLTEHFSFEEYTVGLTYGTVYVTKEAYLHALMMEEFREAIGRPIIVTSYYRTKAKNQQVGGVPNSSHLKGLATDWHTDIPITEALFIKWAKIWKKINRKHGVVGEAGLYSWGIHFGSQITYSKKFANWDSRSGKQKNNVFKI